VTVRAIILAAGTNSRLRNYAIDVPKCLLPIGSSTILERQIGFLKKCGLKKDDIFVVSGHMDDKIRAVHDGLLLNRKYRETDNAYSLHIALAFLRKLPQVHPEDQVLVFDCDLVYDENLISKLIKADFTNLLVTRKENLPGTSKEEVVQVDETGKINKIFRFCDESSSLSNKTNSTEQFVYTGILKMSEGTAKKLDQILIGKKCWTQWYTAAFASLLNASTFFNFPLPGTSFCFDVDTKDDYDRIRDLLKEK
jgi:L-glutamine-phosphate cytidylyltransferase